MKGPILILGFLLALPLCSWADPSPGLRWLQNEPVTLFDWGMRSAEEDLKDLVKNSKKISTYISKNQQTTQMASYSFSGNWLNLYIFVVQPENNITAEECKDLLRTLHKIMLFMGSVNEGDEKKKAYALIDRWFSHEGFKSVDRPETIGQEIAELTTFNISVSHRDGSSISCAIPLTGGSISLTRHEPKAIKKE